MKHAAALHGSGNLLLDALTGARYRKLKPQLVPLRFGQVLTPAAARYVYFPTTAIVSALATRDDGATEEIAITGNEGLIGISAFLEHGSSGGTPPRRAVVHHAGHAWRLPASSLVALFESDDEFQRLLLRYTQALITQIAQTVVCNRYHRIADQLCRWLLLRLDRLPGCELQATQAQIAHLLGVRREGITAAVADLRRSGLIRVRRGRITVLDRSGLEQKVCECYGVIRKEYARLLAHTRRPALSIACASAPRHSSSRSRVSSCSEDRRAHADC